MKVPSKLGKRNYEDEKWLALKVKIGKQKVFFLHLYPKANTFYSHKHTMPHDYPVPCDKLRERPG